MSGPVSVLRVAVCTAALLSLAGCASKTQQFAANDVTIKQVKPAAKKAAVNDEPLASDPVSDMPPMPVAFLKEFKQFKIKKGRTSVAFLKPLVTKVAREPETTASITPMNGHTSAFLAPVIARIVREREEAPVPVRAEPAYALDSGDSVRVFVYGQPSLSRTYPIDGAGFIFVPLIGTVKARGLTTYGLASVVTAQLGQSLVRDPQVTVDLAATRPFYILGEVRSAGQYPYEPNLTLEAAVAIAGGFGSRAVQYEARVTRRIEGKLTKLHLPMTEPVRPGDTITIEERWF